MMILQGVGHPVPYLGVLYANDPKKGGYMAYALAVDLTTLFEVILGAGGDLGSLSGTPPFLQKGSRDRGPCRPAKRKRHWGRAMGFGAGGGGGCELRCSPQSLGFRVKTCLQSREPRFQPNPIWGPRTPPLPPSPALRSVIAALPRVCAPAPSPPTRRICHSPPPPNR